MFCTNDFIMIIIRRFVYMQFLPMIYDCKVNENILQKVLFLSPIYIGPEHEGLILNISMIVYSTGLKECLSLSICSIYPDV